MLRPEGGCVSPTNRSAIVRPIAATMALVSQPAKQLSRILSSAPTPTDRLCWRSSWTGQCAIHVLPSRPERTPSNRPSTFSMASLGLRLLLPLLDDGGGQCRLPSLRFGESLGTTISSSPQFAAASGLAARGRWRIPLLLPFLRLAPHNLQADTLHSRR